MFHIDLRAASRGPVEVTQSVPVADPLVAELDFELGDAVQVSGRLMEAGPGQYFWQGKIQAVVHAECRRCLAAVAVRIDQSVGVLFTEERNPEDPAAYSIPTNATHLDLSEAVREELVLAVPEFALCRDDCRGLCPRCGIDLNTGDCSCQPEADPRWAALEGLKPGRPDHVRE